MTTSLVDVQTGLRRISSEQDRLTSMLAAIRADVRVGDAAIFGRYRPPPRLIIGDLYGLYARDVHGFLRSRVGPDRADDLTSETFVRAIRSLPRFEDRGVTPRAWLLRIARNLVIDDVRRRRPDGRVVDIIPVHATPDAVVDDRDDGRRAAAALAILSESHCAVIDLRFVRDLTVAETARVLDLTDEAVRSLTYRAVKALRSAFVAIP